MLVTSIKYVPGNKPQIKLTSLVHV